MTDGIPFRKISRDEFLEDYYENLQFAYNGMRSTFKKCASIGLTQDHLAEMLDVNKSIISKRLNGTENLELKSLSFMATAMGCRLLTYFIPYDDIGTSNGIISSSSTGDTAPQIETRNTNSVTERLEALPV